MRSMSTALVLILAATLAAAAETAIGAPTPPAATPPSGAAAKWTLVVCAPGYPGTTGQAQPTMDALAAAVGRAAGLEEGTLGAVYHESLAGGLARLEQKDAAFALV